MCWILIKSLQNLKSYGFDKPSLQHQDWKVGRRTFVAVFACCPHQYFIVCKFMFPSIFVGCRCSMIMLHPDYHIVLKYSSIQIKRAQTRWDCVVLLRSSYGQFSALASDPGYHNTIKVLVNTNQTSPSSMGLCRFIAEFLWPPSSFSIIPWLP